MAETQLIIKLLLAFIIRYFLVAGIPFLIFYKLFTTSFSKSKVQKSTASKKDFMREVFYSMQTNLVFLATACLLIFSPIKPYTKIYSDINHYPLWYLPLSVILALIIHDTYFYWMHRTLHYNKLYKAFHYTHHLSTNPSPLASFAFHLGEAIFESAIIIIVVFLIPMHKSAIFAFTLSSLVINVYGHLGYEIMPKWFRKTFLFEIFNTSVHHNMHHQYFEGNYGLYFRLWDRLMGTENKNYVQAYDALQAKKYEKNSEKNLVNNSVNS